ncbi:MAG: hypothetical protein ABSF93_06960, partial [Candidatus Sulfotelmatobacter sp.]
MALAARLKAAPFQNNPKSEQFQRKTKSEILAAGGNALQRACGTNSSVMRLGGKLIMRTER